jgi:hypothetical protein
MDETEVGATATAQLMGNLVHPKGERSSLFDTLGGHWLDDGHQGVAQRIDDGVGNFYLHAAVLST